MSVVTEGFRAIAKFAGDVVNKVCGFVQDAAESHPQVVGAIIIAISIALLVRYVLS